MRYDPKLGTIVPKMRTAQEIGSIAGTLFGKTRRAILSLLFSHSDSEFYLREIIRFVQTGRGSVTRELKALSEAGIILKKKKGLHVYYRANPECPVFTEIKGLIIKTAGVADVLRSALAPLKDKIKLAFIYGSIAKMTERSTSDLDLMVVGDVSLKELVPILRPARKILCREISSNVFSIAEFEERLKAGEDFIRTIWTEEKIILIGDKKWN